MAGVKRGHRHDQYLGIGTISTVEASQPVHTGRLKVRRDNARSEQVVRAMFEVWLLQALSPGMDRESRLEITVSNEGE
jgi:hypothetical protein